jgi:4-alpha-glucanotransferase
VDAQRHWLDDFALFAALLDRYQGALWSTWPTELRDRQAHALQQAHADLSDAIQRVRFEQFIFDRQWRSVRRYANERGVRLIGDIPIFVSWNSADVWCNPELFLLDNSGQPTVVAGVPPDYFSPTGQRWGNPLYRWPAHAERGYSWWIKRFQATFEWVDCVRVDHFRGFEAYWEIPAAAETAIDGHWVKGPGRDVFDHVNRALGHVDIIAEDLGIITAEVEALRDALGYPGMKVLHFGLGDDATSPHAPHNVQRRCVVYTGTHDNNTTVGWYDASTEEEKHQIRVSLSSPGIDIAWEVMHAAWHTRAERAVAPVQDVLRLGADSRMNTPGVADGNWAWRMTPGALTPGHAYDLRSLTAGAGRLQHD